MEGVLLYLERNDHLAAATVNGYRKTATYSLYPWMAEAGFTSVDPTYVEDDPLNVYYVARKG